MAQSDREFQQLLEKAGIKRRFEELLKDDAPAFVSSIFSIYNSNPKLRECSNTSILSAAGIAAALNLPINPSLGFAYIVPYNKQAQFQVGYKGFIQLAMRTNLYRTINASSVYEGQIKEINFITGEIERGEKISDNVVGYVAYLELLNGFNKTIYMTIDEIRAHAEKYSQSYAYDLKNGRKSSVWSTNFDAMARKTVLKKLLRVYAPLDINQRDLRTAIQADQSVITKDGFRYVDNEPDGEEKVSPFDKEQSDTFAGFHNLAPEGSDTEEDTDTNAE